jgi:hypothetical protein
METDNANISKYAELTDDIEMKLDEADRMAVSSDERLSHEEVFGKYRKTR